MLLKCLLVVLAVTAAVPSQTEGQLLDSLVELNALLKRFGEIYDNLQALLEVDLAEVIADLTSPEQLTIYMLYFLDNYTDNLPQEYVCLMRMVVASDAETQEKVRDFIQEAANYYRLVREREEKRLECDAIDTSGLFGGIAHQYCRLQLQQLDIAVNYSYARLSLMVVSLRQTWSDGLNCITSN